MSRPIEVVVQGYYTKVDKKPKNPPAWYAEYLRMRRYPEFRMVIVRYKGEQVLVGALARAMGEGDPWLDVAGRRLDAAGELDFDDLLYMDIAGRGMSKLLWVDLRHVFYAKNGYWIMWIKFLLRRRQSGHRGSYETMLGSFQTAMKGGAKNLFGRINSLFRRRREGKRLAALLDRLEKEARMDAEEQLMADEAQAVLDELGETGFFGAKQGAVSI